MLVLSRKNRQQLLIGDHIKVTVLGINGNTIRLGIEAPSEIRIIRGELVGKQLEGHCSDCDAATVPINALSNGTRHSSRKPQPTVVERRADTDQALTLRISDQRVSTRVQSESLDIVPRQERPQTIPFVPTSGGLTEWLDTLSGSMDS